jgi:hypothetical protein
MSGESTSFNALVKSSTLSRKLFTWPFAKSLAPFAVSDTVCILFSSALDPTPQAHQESNHRADQKHDEKDFGDAGCADSDTTEAEERGNQRDNEKNHGIVKHMDTSSDLKQQPADGGKYRENKSLLQSVSGFPNRRTYPTEPMR